MKTNLYRTFKGLTAIILLVLLGPSNIAAAAKPACEAFEDSVDPKVIEGMLSAANNGFLYQIDKKSSRVEFHVGKFPYGKVVGKFVEFQGGIALDPAYTLVNSGALIKISAHSLTTGTQTLDNIAKGEDMFDTGSYPEILFVGKRFKRVDNKSAHLYGDLTLHGQTRPVVLYLTFNSGVDDSVLFPETVTVEAIAQIRRSEFGVAGLTGLVSDTVTLNIRFDLQRVVI